MRALPKQRFYRGLMTAGLITKKDIPLIERKMREGNRYQQLNVHFTQNRGSRWASKLQAFAKWLYMHREVILQILGIVIMFADDGRPVLRCADEVAREEEAKAKAKAKAKPKRKKKVATKTPDGEPVEDFVNREEVLDELTAESQKLGLYDLGVKDGEVQSGETSGDATGGFESDDV